MAILAGGGGTRLWPMSRRSRPKQFLPLLPGGETLLGATVRRLAPIAPPERVVVITAASQVAEVRRCAPSLPPENLVVEPVGRNTAPCIGLGAAAVLARDPEAIVAVVPSDQHVADEPAFVAAVERAVAEARGGAVVTIGIRPSHPETGFGYIQCAAGGGDVVRFVEKPDRETAVRYVASGDYLWNAGMFFFPARRILDELRALQPAIAGVLDAITAAPDRTGELYPTAPSISIDYAVMEHLPSRGGMRVVRGDFGWSDVGSFAALGDVVPSDAAGNSVLGDAITVDAHRNVVLGSKLVSLVGVDDLVVVATDDAVLVMPRARAQDVRAIVSALESQKRTEYL